MSASWERREASSVEWDEVDAEWEERREESSVDWVVSWEARRESSVVEV